jgi:hypothetical protein
MAEKEILVLSDKNVKPDDKLIFSIIGEKKKQWHSIMNYVSANYKDSSGNWNYYNDGKQWLFKMVNKKKTLFWAAIPDGTFRITFYFGDKAEQMILKSELPEAVKEGFKTTRRYGKIRAISNRIEDVKEIETIYKLIDLKAKL